ncbi:hypothetical protein [Nocardia africana]|uniref:Alkylmercury lyase n=1 Tax=Nocardia africana TaxID=134964 RepID=A0A379X6I1_9NOCA|nr:hypothetical protein [Nocardia africana]MCC3318412.1 alkylmercury lyase [Nocardia africana]SUH71843.1 Uncharacterised protein [Nocardia africana]
MNQDTDAGPHVQLLHVPDCPLLGRVRDTLAEALRRTPIQVVRVDEIEGNYPSPSLLIDGIDVITGEPPQQTACCRFDLPTPEQITTALDNATHIRASDPESE